MWTRKKADPDIVRTVLELVFMNQHKNLNDDMMIRLMPETDSYMVLDALAEARDAGLIYCSGKRWAIRGKYLRERDRS